MANPVNPPPTITRLIDERGIVTGSWIKWFNSLSGSDTTGYVTAQGALTLNTVIIGAGGTTVASSGIPISDLGPAGTLYDLQFNNGGTFGGSSAFKWRNDWQQFEISAVDLPTFQPVRWVSGTQGNPEAVIGWLPRNRDEQEWMFGGEYYNGAYIARSESPAEVWKLHHEFALYQSYEEIPGTAWTGAKYASLTLHRDTDDLSVCTLNSETDITAFVAGSVFIWGRFGVDTPSGYSVNVSDTVTATRLLNLQLGDVDVTWFNATGGFVMWDTGSPPVTPVVPSGTLTDHAVIVGRGTSTVAALASLGTTTTVLHGNAAGDPTYGAIVTGDIAANAVTFAKFQQIATQTLVGRNTAGTGDAESVTISQALDWLT